MVTQQAQLGLASTATPSKPAEEPVQMEVIEPEVASATATTTTTRTVAPLPHEELEDEDDEGRAKRRQPKRYIQEDKKPVLQPLLSIVGKTEFFEWMINLCKALMLVEDNVRGLEVAELGMAAARYFPYGEESRGIILELKEMRMVLYYLNENWQRAFEEVRTLCHKDTSNPSNWTMFNKILARSGMSFHDAPQKFLVRTVNREPDNFAAQVLIANHCLISTNLGLAMAEYSKAMHQRPGDPLVNLCLGIALLLRVMNRRLADRHQLVIQSFSFLYKYAALRISQSRTLAQETKYNLARAHHQLGINHIAEKLYLEVIRDSAPCGNGDDLKMEAAFNLAQMYRENGSPHLARHIIHAYCVI
jgi:tetratricopeptide (TPR) repeat protein